MKQLYLLCIAVAIALFTNGQEANYTMTEPLDISKAGWNIVIQMKNQSTMLFHFEPKKAVVVKVFNQEHKETASRSHSFGLVDVNSFEHSWINGLIEINGEAVLFITQEKDNKGSIFRLRFDPLTAELIEEQKIIESKSFINWNSASLLSTKQSEKYYLVYKDRTQGQETTITTKGYNANHQIFKDVTIPLNDSLYTDNVFNECIIDDVGNILIVISQVQKNQPENAKNKSLLIAFLPDKHDSFSLKRFNMNTDIGFFDIDVAMNSFFRKINFCISLSVSNVDLKQFSSSKIRTLYRFFLIANDDLSDFQIVDIGYNKMLESLYKGTDTNYYLRVGEGPLFINDFGISTIIYPGSYYHRKTEDKWMSCFAVGQYNEKGEELWSTVLPHAKLNYIDRYPSTFLHTSQKELTGYKILNYKNKAYYIIYNNVDSEFDKDLKSQAHDEFPYTNTNAIYYTIKKRNVTKSYLFGQPDGQVFNHIYTGATSFNEETNTLAVLVRSQVGKSDDIKLAWVKLEG